VKYIPLTAPTLDRIRILHKIAFNV
jgi:hypothetical protein